VRLVTGLRHGNRAGRPAADRRRGRVRHGPGGLTAFQLRGTALEDLAVLLIDGPLRGLLPVQALEAEQRLMDSIERGI
jgi:hypothetical protein